MIYRPTTQHIIAYKRWAIISGPISFHRHNSDTTRKRGKSQRVARPACANSTMHFLLTYRLAMLVPPSE